MRHADSQTMSPMSQGETEKKRERDPSFHLLKNASLPQQKSKESGNELLVLVWRTG